MKNGNIYWIEDASDKQIVDVDTFIGKFRELQTKSGFKQIVPNSDRIAYLEGGFAVVRYSPMVHLRWADEDGYHLWMTNSIDGSKNGRKESGSKALKRFKDRFFGEYGISMADAFGFVDEEFKRHIPKQLYYTCDIKELNGNYYFSASAIDGCSQYPSNSCGILPDSNTAVVVDGMVEPSEEYPFAFYDNGHLAIYGSTDTRKWLDNKLFKCLFRFDGDLNSYGKPEKWFLKFECHKTTLMKASKYKLDDIWQYFYAQRKGNKDFKVVMNATIGCWHRTKYNRDRFAHLAAVTIARANDSLLKKVAEIGLDNVIQICVDGISYKGAKEYGVHEKGLGIYHQEFTDCEMVITDINRYVVMKDDEPIKFAHQGCNRYPNGNLIEDVGFKDLTDIYDWELYNPWQGIRID